MRQVFLLLILASIAIVGKAQLVAKAKCDAFVVDVIDGKVNGLKPNARFTEIQEKFPCFTSAEPEGGAAKCGASIFYKDRDVRFYTDRDYIEIGENFRANSPHPSWARSVTVCLKYWAIQK